MHNGVVSYLSDFTGSIFLVWIWIIIDKLLMHITAMGCARLWAWCSRQLASERWYWNQWGDGSLVMNSIGVGAHSTLGGHPIFAGKKMYEKLSKCPNFTWFLPEKNIKIPDFHDIGPERLPKFRNFTGFFCPKNARILHLIALPDPHRLRLWWIPLNWWQQKPSAGDSNMLRKSAMAIHEEGKGWVWYSTVICCMQRTG